MHRTGAGPRGQKKTGLISSRNAQKLAVFAVLLFIFMILEIVYALITGSVSLLSDALHMVSDLAATILAIYGIAASQKPKTSTFTYGLGRAEVHTPMAAPSSAGVWWCDVPARSSAGGAGHTATLHRLASHRLVLCLYGQGTHFKGAL